MILQTGSEMFVGSGVDALAFLDAEKLFRERYGLSVRDCIDGPLPDDETLGEFAERMEEKYELTRIDQFEGYHGDR